MKAPFPLAGDQEVLKGCSLSNNIRAKIIILKIAIRLQHGKKLYSERINETAYFNPWVKFALNLNKQVRNYRIFGHNTIDMTSTSNVSH